MLTTLRTKPLSNNYNRGLGWAIRFRASCLGFRAKLAKGGLLQKGNGKAST